MAKGKFFPRPSPPAKRSYKLKNTTILFHRLLQRWICSPLGNIKNIKARQEAVGFLRDCVVNQDVRGALSQLPDLERLLSRFHLFSSLSFTLRWNEFNFYVRFYRIHSQGSNGIKEAHPETRAILFEEKTYSKRKIIDFISAINGFKTAQKIINFFKSKYSNVILILIVSG